MRILVNALSPGYVRNFESTLRLLAERGHTIQLVFNASRERVGGQWLLVEGLEREFPAVSHEILPEPELDRWAILARYLRRAGDYLRYLEPRYGRSEHFRARAGRRTPPVVRRVVESRAVRAEAVRSRATRVVHAVERALPVPPSIEELVRERDPDLVLVTPLISMAGPQVDLLRAAVDLGVPTVGGIYSWDNLTTKGTFWELPDVLTVWNEIQRREAVELHGVPVERVAVTGAQGWDHWFDWRPSTTHEEFARGRSGSIPTGPSCST